MAIIKNPITVIKAGANPIKTTTISSGSNLYSFLNNASNTILSIELTLKQIVAIQEIAQVTLGSEVTTEYNSYQLMTNDVFILNMTKSDPSNSNGYIYLTGKLSYSGNNNNDIINVTFIISNSSSIQIFIDGLYKSLTNSLIALFTTNYGTLSTFDCKINYIENN